MKIKILIFLFSFALLGCEKRDDNSQVKNEDIIGEWVNTTNNNDTLFINDSVIIRIDTTTMRHRHKYSYTLDMDSIRIIYTGGYYIFVPGSSHKLLLDKNKSILSIENMDSYFPGYKGDKFERVNSN